MTVTEEFKLAIKTGKFREALLLLISQAFDLTVTTSINGSQPIKLQTRINVVAGEINHQIDANLLDYQGRDLLEQLHFAQVKIAPELMVQYLQNWQRLSGLIVTTENIPIVPTELNKLDSQQTASLPEQQATPENEWSDMLEEVQNVEIVDTVETEEEEEDWGDWMEDENWEANNNNQSEPKQKDDEN